MKLEYALVGIVLMALVGWLIGAVLEHPPSSGFEIIGALIGALIALSILFLGEAFKAKREK